MSRNTCIYTKICTASTDDTDLVKVRDAIFKKYRKRLFLLHKLRSRKSNSEMVQPFYLCCVESVLMFNSFVVWWTKCEEQEKMCGLSALP